jgi:hypothetical protein
MSRMLSHRSMPLHTEEKMSRSELGFGSGCGVSLQHPLAFAGTFWHRVIVNQETTKRVAADLGFDHSVCSGVVRILKKVGRVPSAERLAVICQLDYGLNDADIGEIFGKDADWSAFVRRYADLLREREPIPAQLEWLDEGLQPSDPPPEELYRRALEVRVTHGRTRQLSSGIRAYSWRSRNASFVQVGVD